MLERIEHVQLAMPAGCESQARSFYSTLLGLDEVPKPAHLVARGGCWFESAVVKIHLGVEDDFRPARKAHPAFVVDDLDALAVVLDEAGVTTRDDPAPGWVRRIYVDDPFGNRLEFMQPLAG